MSADLPLVLLIITTTTRDAWSVANTDILNALLKIEAEK